jgi:hypothetical protein
MPIRFDRYARRRMTQRAITPQEVEAVLRHPEWMEPSIKERRNAFGPGLRGDIVRVTFRETPDEILVITVVRQRSGGRGQS